MSGIPVFAIAVRGHFYTRPGSGCCGLPLWCPQNYDQWRKFPKQLPPPEHSKKKQTQELSFFCEGDLFSNHQDCGLSGRLFFKHTLGLLVILSRDVRGLVMSLSSPSATLQAANVSWRGHLHAHVPLMFMSGTPIFFSCCLGDAL